MVTKGPASDPFVLGFEYLGFSACESEGCFFSLPSCSASFKDSLIKLGVYIYILTGPGGNQVFEDAD